MTYSYGAVFFSGSRRIRSKPLVLLQRINKTSAFYLDYNLRSVKSYKVKKGSIQFLKGTV